MAERWRLYSSGEATEVEQVTDLVASLEDVELEAVPEARLLEGRVQLPFIEVENGNRHFGISGITRYVWSRRNMAQSPPEVR